MTCEIGMNYLESNFSRLSLITCVLLVAYSWGASSVLGIDIDDTLIRAAWKRRRTLWSSMEHPPTDLSGDTAITGAQDGSVTPVEHFPASCVHMHGPLPIPESVVRDRFPHNVTFRTENWSSQGPTDDERCESYDVVLAYVGYFTFTLTIGVDISLVLQLICNEMDSPQ